MGQPCGGGAGGGQLCHHGDELREVPSEVCCGGGSIAEDACDAGAFCEERVEVVWGGVADIGVQTAVSFAGFEDVPERYVVLEEACESSLVGQSWVEVEELSHDRPECVVPEGVVLLLSQRFHAGHRAQDEHFGVVLPNRRKGFTASHLFLTVEAIAKRLAITSVICNFPLGGGGSGGALSAMSIACLRA